jgi:hypothetical protein
MWDSEGSLVDEFLAIGERSVLDGAVQVSRDDVDVGRPYLELTGYANALRMGRE